MTQIEPPTTQRAYTLRLRGVDSEDASWRDALWATHEAVNKGAKAFGDWLLTLRGGLDHTLADTRVPAKGKKPERDPTPEERRDRRILLALSWLSVESAPKTGDPHEKFVIASGNDSHIDRNERVLQALRDTLGKRGISSADIDSWIADCESSLSAAIRDDAVWINRSASFDAARQRVGDSLARKVVWDMLEPFLGSHTAYLTPLKSEETTEDTPPTEDKAKDLVQKAGQWLSSRFGTGKGADFNRMAKVYEAISDWARGQKSFSSGNAALAALATSLASFNPQSNDAKGILKLISGPGYKSATRNIIKAWADQSNATDAEALKKLVETAAADIEKCRSNTGGKGQRPYADAILNDAQSATGFTYLQQDGGSARHSEFAVMLDHAARRVSIAHTWIKRAEAERQKLTSDTEKLNTVPQKVKQWLDEFCERRSSDSGALDAYRIRRRAAEGWKEVVARWSRTDCKTAEDRIAAAREIQADPDIDKFGDIQLFEALAADDALCVWQMNHKVDTQPLLDYVAGSDALAKQKRFKVPAYRHPDPLLHPVFCDFGNSRWDIEFAVHQAHTQLGKTKENVKKKEESLVKAQAQRDKAKSPDRLQKAEQKVAEAEKKLQECRDELNWLSSQCQLRMGLWNGHTVETQNLRWSSKRLTDDLGLKNNTNGKETTSVSRADRLGRAAGGAAEEAPVSILSVFDEKHWNGRLQAPREQLNAIADRLKKNNGQWNAKARDMRNHIRWLVSFSAKLQPAGPWIYYAGKHKLIDPSKEVQLRPRNSKDEWRGLSYPFWHPDNEGRKGHAKPLLSRLPGLRVLSVDLGHRFAAACTVWETISTDAIKREIGEQTIRAGGLAEDDLYCHVETPTDKITKKGRHKGKPITKITVYRRIGEDFLRDPKTGKPTTTPHPAPWARLDRQFFIKLPGEEQSARAASNKGDVNEVDMVAAFADRLGLTHDEDRDKGRAVDRLMSRAVRLATLGLKRHARRAKIAYALDPATKSIPGIGGSEKVFQIGDDDHVKLLTNALFDWHALATDARWNDKAARDLWNQHIANLDGGRRIDEPTPADPQSDEPTRHQRRKNDEKLRDEKIKPIAQRLATAERAAMHAAWRKRWDKDDGKERTKDDFEHTLTRNENGKVIGSCTSPKPGKESPAGFHAELRWLTDWIMGRRLSGATGHGWRQNVGGLSLTRIATMRSLYQLHKAFAMRAKPHKPRGAPEKGETNAGVARSILTAMEKMREQRVKQLASRIAASALGLGGHWKCVERKTRIGKPILGQHGKPCTKRVWVEEPSRKYEPCHAVVIENLTNYRPDEIRTRRENRQLMAWSSSKVKKYLSEACQLHSLHLREVQAGYTSRQDSRTGAPGMRCNDIAIKDFLTAAWWRRQVNRANEKVKQNKGDAYDRYLHELDKKAARTPEQNRPRSIRIPVNGGDLFVSTDKRSPASKGLQADLNAAANIGLRALLDPDFPGKWWYVPCNSSTNIPHDEKTKGSLAIESSAPLISAAQTESQAPDTGAGKRPSRAKAAKKQREIVNLWRDPSTAPIDAKDDWHGTSEYWNHVRCRVVDLLRHVNAVEAVDTPW